MTQTILFRFHQHYDVCEQNLQMLAKLNPDAAIHGLYGGRDEIADLPESLRKRMLSVEQPFDDPFYCWKESDLVVRKWYQTFGRTLSFDHLYLVEWDLLFLTPLHKALGKPDVNTNYTTIHATHAQALEKSWTWISGHYEGETAKLKEEIAALAKPVTDDVGFGVMCGTVFCREFLDRYAAIRPSSYSNDETRLAYWSQAFDIPLRDNRFYQNPANIISGRRVLTNEHIEEAQAAGAVAIHPVRHLLPPVFLEKLKA